MNSDEKKSVTLQSGRLQIGFHWHRDRYAHTIGVVDEGRFDPLLASQEGSGEELWPASPALQAIQVDTTADRQVALLVGMAGRSHWSMAVELDSARSQLRFDVACRVKDEPPSAGGEGPAGVAGALVAFRSSYRTIISPTVGPEIGNLVTVGEIAISIATAADGDGPVDFGRLRVAAEGITIDAANDCRELPRTVRWAYMLGPHDQ